jgi:hypothetical protein
MWIRHNLPHESGYYLTVHEMDGRNLYKAFWFDTNNLKWNFRFEPNVKAFWNVRHDYYVPCQMQEGVDPYRD